MLDQMSNNPLFSKRILRMKKSVNYFILGFALLILLQSAETLSPPTEKHFVVIHGACHGAWSWYKVVAMLRFSGHNVTALDLGASGIDPLQVLEIPRQSDYFRPLMVFMADLSPREKVILVAHSLGGLAVSKAMETFPEKISVAVFVTATMPGPFLNISTLTAQLFRRQGPLLDSKYTYDNGPNKPPTTLILGSNYIAQYMYQLSPVEDLALATTLLRPIYLYTEEDMSNELILSQKKYGCVDRVYIKAGEDKSGNKDVEQGMIQRNPPNEVIEIADSDHMVMMSRPLQLFLHLLSLAQRYD